MAYWRNQFFLSKTNNASFISSIFDLSGNISTITNVFNNNIARHINIDVLSQQTNGLNGFVGLLFSNNGFITNTSDIASLIYRQTHLSSNVSEGSSLFNFITNKQSNISTNISSISDIIGYPSNILFGSSYISILTSLDGSIYNVTNFVANILSNTNIEAIIKHYLITNINTVSLSSVDINSSRSIFNISNNISQQSNINSVPQILFTVSTNIDSLSSFYNSNIHKIVNINGNSFEISHWIGNLNKTSNISIDQIDGLSIVSNNLNYKIISIQGSLSSETDVYIYIIPIVEISALPIYSTSDILSENSFLRYSAYHSDILITFNLDQTVYISNSVYIDGEILLWATSE